LEPGTQEDVLLELGRSVSGLDQRRGGINGTVNKARQTSRFSTNSPNDPPNMIGWASPDGRGFGLLPFTAAIVSSSPGIQKFAGEVQMNIQVLGGLAQMADDYDLFILDLWGVVHDGIAVYPGAENCLRRLRQREKRVALLSNTARLGASIAPHLTELGVEPELYDWLLTSGDATADAIASEAIGTGADERPTYFHLGPERCRPTLGACGGREVTIEAAETIICTGLFDDETDQVEEYRDLLAVAAARGLPMICVNPDMVANRGGRMVPCAGAVAALYEELGGTVRRFGKPFPDIFNRLFAKIPEIPRVRAVMIGDSLATDIRGARRAGIDAIWVAGGIHAKALALSPDGRLDQDRVHEIAEQSGERPKAMLPWLRW
jgi:HAD superfamily hydrolase (TIGR01459 family)